MSLLLLTSLITYNVNAQGDSWTTKQSMQYTRRGLGLAVVNEGIYALGGVKDGAHTTIIEKYDPELDIWTLKGNMLGGFYRAGVAVVNNLIYCIGINSNLVQIYNPETEIWSNGTNMPTPRHSFATAVIDNKIYCIGGEAAGGDWLDTIEVYDTGSNSWSTKSPMPTKRRGLSSGVIDNKIIAIGGFTGNYPYENTGIVEIYDPNTNSWDLKSSMPTPREYFGLAVINNSIYTIGGDQNSPTGVNYQVVNKVEIYDYDTDTWSQGTPLPTPRTQLGVVELGGKIYAIGGASTTYSSETYTTFYEYSKNEVYTPYEPDPISAPSVPLNLQATAGDGKVILDWSAPASDGGASITNYKIYRGITTGGETLHTTVDNVLTYTDLSVTNGHIYYYKVSAINSVGEGTKSNSVSATPITGTTAPSAPGNLQATAGDGQVTLTWAVPSSDGGLTITNYKIYRGASSGIETYLTNTENVLIYTDTSVTNDQTYYYKVRAINSVGEGAFSNEVSATPTATDSAQDGLLDSDDDSSDDIFTTSLFWLVILVGVAAVIGIGLYSRMKKPPEKESDEQSSPEE